MSKFFFFIALLVVGMCAGKMFSAGQDSHLAHFQYTKMGLAENGDRLSPAQQAKIRDALIHEAGSGRAPKQFHYPSASEYSRALWLQNQGYTGAGTTIGVIEKGGVWPDEKKGRLIAPDKEKGRVLSIAGSRYHKKDEQDHAQLVCDVLQQIAPGARLLIKNIKENPNTWQDSDGKGREEEISVINQSAGVAGNDLDLKLFSSWIRHHTIIVSAAGNGSKALTAAPEDLQGNIILVGAVNGDPFSNFYRGESRLLKGSVLTQYTNYPGDDLDIQKCFIVTIGNDIIANSSKGPDYIKGTSYAAPIVTGCIALLKEAFPDMSAADLREAILNSADRSFFGVLELNGRSFPVYTTDNEDYINSWEAQYGSLRADAPPGHAVQVKKFNPSLYGQGVLNLENAFKYVKIKKQHPDWAPEQLRRALLDQIQGEHQTHAVHIQKHARGYLARKKPQKLKKKKDPVP